QEAECENDEPHRRAPCRGTGTDAKRCGRIDAMRSSRRGRLLARLQDVLDRHLDVRLGMTLQAAVIFAPAELLDHRLPRWEIGNLGNYPCSFHERSADHRF